MYNPQLNTFLIVTQAGSFNKAAEELFISTPAVIKQINHLEQALGVKLFVRSHKGLILTESGQSFYEDTKQIIKLCNEAVKKARNAASENDYVIRVGTSFLTPGQFILDFWPEIRSVYPEIQFQLIPFENSDAKAREILRSLGQDIDVVAAVFDKSFLESRKCAGLELFSMPFRCAVPVHHRLAGKESLTIKDLYGEHLMLIHRGWSQHMDKLRDDLQQFHPQIHLVNFDAFKLEIFHQCENSNSLLITIDPWEGIYPLLKNVPVEWNYSIPFGLLHSPAPSHSVRLLLDAFQTIFKQDGEN